MWLTLQDQQGKLWRYNDEGVKQICWAWARAANLLRFSFVNKDTLTAAVVFTTTVASVETDFEAIRLLTDSNAYAMKRQIKEMFLKSGEEARVKLASMRNQTRAYLREYQQMLDEADTINKKAISDMTRNEGVAKFVRDTGATACCATAAIVAAPAGVAVSALGVGMKGAFKYQDTGNLGAAGVEVICEGFMVLCGGSAAAAGVSNSGKVIMAIFLKAPMEMAKSVAQGDTLKQGMAAGLVEIGGEYIGWGLDVVGKKLAKAPLLGWITSGGELAEQTAEMTRATVEGRGADYAKDRVKSAVADTNGGPVVSKNLAQWREGCVNLIRGGAKEPSSDADYVKTFCIQPI